MVDLTVCIAARNEMWLNNTIEDVLAHAKGNTEIIAVLDGALPTDPIPQHPRLTVIILPDSIGQRAAVNLAAKLSDARFIMKLDAHCAVGDGFDLALIKAAEELGRDVVQIPMQYNFHVFDWQCNGCGKRTYQGPTPQECEHCHATEFHRELVWQRRMTRKTTAWRFDSDMKFAYWGGYQDRPEGKGELTETMSCLGACWFVDREWYWELGGLDESHGSWGQMGTEIACKAWLSGGRMICNQRTWFSHLFRTQGGDFGFPYPLAGSAQERARVYSRSLWLNDAWPKATRPLSWLLEHFGPVPTWEKGVPPKPGTKVSRGIIYYSDCAADPALLDVCRQHLQKVAGNLPIVSCTLKPVDLGRNIVIERHRGYHTMAIQILTALEALDAEIVYFCEHDVLYHPSHFQTADPPDAHTYQYNQNCWKVDAENGRAVYYSCNQLSGLCARRDLLINHFTARIQRIAAVGYSTAMGFEPGTHKREERIDDYWHVVVNSVTPNIDLRHNHNLTPTRWKPDLFRTYPSQWTESDAVPGWGVTLGRMPAFLQSLVPAGEIAYATV